MKSLYVTVIVINISTNIKKLYISKLIYKIAVSYLHYTLMSSYYVQN